MSLQDFYTIECQDSKGFKIIFDTTGEKLRTECERLSGVTNEIKITNPKGKETIYLPSFCSIRMKQTWRFFKAV